MFAAEQFWWHPGASRFCAEGIRFGSVEGLDRRDTSVPREM